MTLLDAEPPPRRGLRLRSGSRCATGCRRCHRADRGNSRIRTRSTASRRADAVPCAPQTHDQDLHPGNRPDFGTTSADESGWQNLEFHGRRCSSLRARRSSPPSPGNGSARRRDENSGPRALRSAGSIPRCLPPRDAAGSGDARPARTRARRSRSPRLGPGASVSPDTWRWPSSETNRASPFT